MSFLAVRHYCLCCRTPSAPALGVPGIPGMKSRSWKEQSEAITEKLQEAKSRSPATVANVRLHEALHQCSLMSGCSVTQDAKPHRLRTAVCCKLLEELSTLAGPYADMLQILCKELVSYHALSRPQYAEATRQPSSTPINVWTGQIDLQRLLCP